MPNIHGEFETGVEREQIALEPLWFWKIEWPGSARPTMYYDPRALELDGPGGVLRRGR